MSVTAPLFKRADIENDLVVRHISSFLAGLSKLLYGRPFGVKFRERISLAEGPHGNPRSCAAGKLEVNPAFTFVKLNPGRRACIGHGCNSELYVDPFHIGWHYNLRKLVSLSAIGVVT